MTLRQDQPIIAGMFHQPPARLHQPLLQAGQRLTVDLPGQHQPSQVPRLQAITLSHSRTSFDRNRWQLSRVNLTACLPSLIHMLRDPSLVMKPHRRLARQGHVSHNESDPREPLPWMMPPPSPPPAAPTSSWPLSNKLGQSIDNKFHRAVTKRPPLVVLVIGSAGRRYPEYAQISSLGLGKGGAGLRIEWEIRHEG
jgi:hypothetical protein